MAWSRKKKQDEAFAVVEMSAPTRTISGKTTIIGPEIVIEGKLEAGEDVIISGTVKGSIISSQQIVVAPSGKVEGEISCAAIFISGEVKGNVKAREQVVIESSGRLIGDFTTRTLTHQPGGFFEGYSHMLQEPSEARKDTRGNERHSAKESGKKEGKAP